MGFDIVYLPPIHPIGEVNRKGRNSAAEPGGTVNPDPRDVGSPWAIGSKDGGHDAVHPELGTIDDFDEFVAAARERGLEMALDLALQCAPDHPWVDQPPGMVHHPAGRIDRLRREPAQEVPGHLPDELRQRPRRGLRRGAPGRPVLDRPRRDDLPGGQPAHQADQLLGVADRQGAREEPGGHLPGRGVHQAGDDARTGPDRVHPVLHLLHLADLQAGAHRLRGRAGRGLGLHAAELLRQHPGHPARVAAVRRSRDVRDPGRAGRHPVADLGGVLRVRAVRARGGQAGQRGVPATRRSTSCARGTTRRRSPRAGRWSR